MGVALSHLSFRYPTRGEDALRALSFEIPEGAFALLCGETGSGKTTLLRLLKPELRPRGKLSGIIRFFGQDAEPDCFSVGYVGQRPDGQLVTDKVWHELAFGLESMGMDSAAIRRRICETADWFGIAPWFERDTNALSGGQKQLLLLASVMVTEPRLLLLDEPTAQLDPIAASEFLQILLRIHRELGVTIIWSEHRLEELLSAADQVICLHGGQLLVSADARAAAEVLGNHAPLEDALPAALRIHSALRLPSPPPLSGGEGRIYFAARYGGRSCPPPQLPPRPKPPKEPLAELRDVWFRYERGAADVLRGASLRLYGGEIYALLGGNGSGKTTLMQMLAGLLKPQSGMVRVLGKPLSAYKGNSLYDTALGLLPQDVSALFARDTMREELSSEDGDSVSAFFSLHIPPDVHPDDLSGGERQLCALALLLRRKPRVLLLDEPAKGLDARHKRCLLDILRTLRAEGVAVCVVTHDAEFAALCADRCGLFFGGETVSEDSPERFFSGNRFYTTAAARVTRGVAEGLVTAAAAADYFGRLEEGLQ